MYKKISVLIPVYNEYHTIERCLERVLKADVGNLEMEVIISDNNSNDGTKEILGKISDQRVKILYRKENNGKGANIKNALKEASGDLILFQDGDLEYSPDDYLILLDPFFLYNADVVYGSRYMTTDATRVLLFWHGVANRILTLLSNMVTNLYLTDMETGYKVFKSIHLKNLKIEEKRFGFEPEVTIKLAKKKLFFYEVGIAYHGRGYAEGKKIGVKDAFRALYCLIKYTIKS